MVSNKDLLAITQILIDIVQHHETIEYGQVSKRLSSNYHIYIAADQLKKPLDHINRVAHKLGLPHLSVVVTSKGDKLPGAGFYKLMREINPKYNKEIDNLEIWAIESKEVYKQKEWGALLDEFRDRTEIVDKPIEEPDPTQWLIPCNVKYYDVIGAFKKFKIIDWKQSNNTNVGDTVYIYIGQPWQQIKYKCIVRAIDLKEASSEDSEFILDGSHYVNYGRYMRLELVDEYIDGVFTNKELKENGVISVQGPRTIPETLKLFIDKTLTERQYTCSRYSTTMDDESIKEMKDFQLELDARSFKDETEKEVVVKARMGHGALKKYILKKEHSCRVCGLQDERFLIASHIKPWSISDEQERLDENNILLLCPHHDAAFDKGYITFDKEGKMLISSGLSLNTRALLNLVEGHKIELRDNNKKYIEWHRENIFKP